MLALTLPHDSSIFLTENPPLQLSPQTISFQVSRDTAYYLGAIPPPLSSTELWFDWVVNISITTGGVGSIQFSQDNSTWSNLVSFTLVSGQANGRQFIDSSWAAPGVNYLRAAYSQSFSPDLPLFVYVNYYTTVLLVLSPFLAFAVLAPTIFYLRRRKKR